MQELLFRAVRTENADDADHQLSEAHQQESKIVMGDGSFVRHLAFGSQKTLHTIGMVVHDVSRVEQRRLLSARCRQSLVPPKLAE